MSAGAWLSPQAPQIPVVKRGAQYELDLKTLAKGKPLTAIKLDIEPPVDLEGYQNMHGALPKSLQYVCETGALSTNVPTMEVAAAGFDLYHPATLVTDANGTLTCDVASPMANELVLLDGTTPTFTATSAPGYQIATLKVGEKDITVNKDATSQTLTLPPVTDAVTITATFKEIPVPPKPPIINHYNVTPTVENGTIDPAHPTTVRKGNSLKYTFSPKEGYALESVSVNGELVKATEDSTTTAKTYSYTINSIYSDTTIHVVCKAVEPPVGPIDPIDPPKPPVDPTDPVDPIDPPKPPVDPAEPVVPPTPPALPDNGGNGNNNGGGTTIVERTNTVTVPAAPQAAAPETPAAQATAATKTEAVPAQATADTATTQGQLENPALGAQGFDTQHSHIPLALLLLAVWLVGGFAVIRQRKHTHDAIEGASY